METPNSWLELKLIIQKRYTQCGAGTSGNPVDFNDIDVSAITNMSMLFSGRMMFRYIDISEWDVSNVTDMTGMFSGCSTLQSIGDVSEWNVSNVSSMNYMFNGCNNQIIPSWYK